MGAVVYWRTNDATKGKLATIAEREGRSVQFVLEQAVRAWLDQQVASTTQPAPKQPKPASDSEPMVTLTVAVPDVLHCKIRNYRSSVREATMDRAIERLLGIGLRQATRKPAWLEDPPD
jgi:hypothetical protein